MTSEEKVKKVWPKAWCYDQYPDAHIIFDSHPGKLPGQGFGDTPRAAWTNAWRRIQQERKTR